MARNLHKHQATSAGQVAQTKKIEARTLSLLVTSGNLLFDQGDLTQALDLFNQAVEIIQKNISGHGRNAAVCFFNLARVHAALNHTDEAIRYYEQAIKIMPRFAEANNNLGMLLNQQNRFAEAAEHFNKAIAAESLFASPYYGLGVSLQNTGDTTNAAFAYQRALTLKPDFYPAWVNLGIICHQIGSFEVAINCYTEAIAIAPDNPELYFNRGLAHMGVTQLKEAIADFSQALELNPDYALAKDALQEAVYFSMPDAEMAP